MSASTLSPLDPVLAQTAAVSPAWPFEEARKIVARIGGVEAAAAAGREVLFETGYGPSGLPHIGTFGEVARTSMVRHAFHVLTEDRVRTRLIAFSDDMDGLRKVPDNVPNKEMVRANLGKPLTEIPDPFGTHESFAAHNNARLRAFLDRFGFDYEFMSSTTTYRAGRFDDTLLLMLERYDEVMAIMLASLRAERAQSYSPFLPIHPVTRVVMQVPIEERDVARGSITWRDPATGERFETKVTGGDAKLQWKPDWAMRWVALGVDYEMAGKDLIDSVKLSAEICRALGAAPPEGFNYELFLDENGKKISKSIGNGLTIDQWLSYGTPESLSLFMYQNPRAAKRLYFDVIPRQVDDYLTFRSKYEGQAIEERLKNPAWHIHAGAPPRLAAEGVGRFGANILGAGVDYAMLLNLVSASNASDRDTLWGFIKRYAPGVDAQGLPELDRLVELAIRYYEDFVRPTKRFKAPSEAERAALADLDSTLAALPRDADAATIQAAVYEVGRMHFPDTTGKAKTADGRPGVSQAFFQSLYRILLGQERGPRFGSFVEIYGIAETRALIAAALAGELTPLAAA
ncbi:lysyl-tRNA synthetase, class I [Rhizobiales bacterium GAS113]|nr:lysyl-tRNA synthetase, class I [Rhizobiales bacterium GAS113]